MNNEKHFSEEQLDFLREMMNVGGGNAVTALSQMLQRDVEMKIPTVHSVPAAQVPPILGNPSLPVTCVRMGMVGDAAGHLFFIVPDEHKAKLIHFVRQATPGPLQLRNAESGTQSMLSHQSLVDSQQPVSKVHIKNGDLTNDCRLPTGLRNPNSAPGSPQSHDMDLSIVIELGNIIAGVYLTAIHDFCKLNIYHTLPALAIDMIQSLLDEAITALSREAQIVFIIENEFIVEEHHIKTFFLMLPTTTSVQKLVGSMEHARVG